MELAFSADQLVLFDAFGQFFTHESPPSVVRRAEPLGFDAPLWASLNAMEVWGSDAPFGDLCVIAETAGRSLAPVPLVDHTVVSRLLKWTSLLSGESIAAISPRSADDHGVWRLVPSGAVADVVVGMDHDEFVAILAPAPFSGPRNHACAPVADRSARVGERVVIGSHQQFETAMAEWKVLTAATLVGVAAIALEMAVAYVQQRHQFGVAIGSFQAVQHGLADLPGRIDGARLLVHEAAEAIDLKSDRQPDAANNEITDAQSLASMAFLFASDIAADSTSRSLHFHGGYGFAEEYDIQLAYRRARGWSLVLGDPGAELLTLSDRLWPRPSASQNVGR